jgi:hypothetical protein
VNSGQWYQDTYDKVIADPTKDFLCPIIFAMDKTVISEISHLSVHIILFTTTIFNREVCVMDKLLCLLMFVSLTCMIQSFQTRNKAMAWRPLAYIPDQDLHYHY